MKKTFADLKPKKGEDVYAREASSYNLKEVAPLNMPFIFITFEVSQAFILGASCILLSLKADSILVVPVKFKTSIAVIFKLAVP
jgi:hypothetical protein